MTNLALDEFSVSNTTKIAEAVCRANGWAANVHLLRLGQNATYRIQEPSLVLRVARTTNREDVTREIEVARWLAKHDYPATRVADDIAPDQPVECAGRFTSIWEPLEEDSDVKPSMNDLAHLLRKLHALHAPPSLALPAFDPLGRMPERIAAAPDSVSEADKEFLVRYAKELQSAYDGLTFNLASGPIHSDAHPGNVLRATNGSRYLVDLEYFANGPREWDLMLPAAYRYGFDWISASEYESFVSIYGYDVSRDSCFPVLRAIRELNMTVWIMQNVDHRDDIRIEFEQRVSDLRNPSAERRWKRF
ncbi:aminoglycoside phosphotransferase family protein [Kitasatospora sp. NPDC005751]|uniref:phosphotransferase enzyme family protein n=1 Tax=Kitasatospora sp. NPDC005751 TaxID=3157064 RepID=UPI0033CACC12